MTASRELRFCVGERSGEVSALLELPRNADRLLVLAHGAGAGMRHPFLEATSARLAARGIASFRYQFPYMEAGRRGPSPRPVLLETVRAAVDTAAKEAGGLPLLAGGKSMGGRMTSLAACEAPLPGVTGLVFLGFPLHAAGRPASARSEHLEAVDLPMLFLQGTRDKLAELDRIHPVCRTLGDRATLHLVEGGDHTFHVLKRSGRTDDEALDEIADAIRNWAPATPPSLRSSTSARPRSEGVALHALPALADPHRCILRGMEINGIAHTLLTVGDFARSREFYAKLLPFLGLQPVLDGDGFYYCVGGRTAFGIRPASAENAGERFEQQRVGLHHVCFRARERAHVDALHEFLVEIDAAIVHPPEEGVWAPGYYSVLFEDPDGIRLEMNFVPGKGLLESQG